MNLFQKGRIQLSEGSIADFKIECDALTDEDIECIAWMISEQLEFKIVMGIPTGGIRLEKALRKYATKESKTVLLCDDVLTTGNSMEKMKAKFVHKDIIGVVIFARRKCPEWVSPLFKLW